MGLNTQFSDILRVSPQVNGSRRSCFHFFAAKSTQHEFLSEGFREARAPREVILIFLVMQHHCQTDNQKLPLIMWFLAFRRRIPLVLPWLTTITLGHCRGISYLYPLLSIDHSTRHPRLLDIQCSQVIHFHVLQRLIQHHPVSICSHFNHARLAIKESPMSWTSRKTA